MPHSVLNLLPPRTIDRATVRRTCPVTLSPCDQSPTMRSKEPRDLDHADRGGRHRGGPRRRARTARLPAPARLRAGRLRPGGAAPRVRRRRRHRLRRVRPDGAVAARRPPARHDDAGHRCSASATGRSRSAAAAPRWSATLRARPRPGPSSPRRRSGPTWRASCRSSTATSISTGGRLGRQSAGAAAQQRRLAARAALHPVPARHRPPLLGQRDAGRRDVPHPAGDDRAQLRRVQLPDGAGLRLPPPLPHRGLRLADGRLRPVGQHRRRRRADPQGRRRRRPSPSSARC